MALRLKHRGITRVHPLDGGLARWLDLHYPVEQLAVTSPAPAVSEQP